METLTASTRLSLAERRELSVAIRERMRATLPQGSPVITEFWCARDTYTDEQLHSIATAHGVIV